MAMAQSLWGKRKKMASLTESLFQLQAREGILTVRAKPNVNTKIKIMGLKGEAEHGGSSSSSSSSGGIDSGDVRILCKQGRLKEAHQLLYTMSQQGIRAESSTYTLLLQECLSKEAMPEGKLVYAHMIDIGCNPDVSLGNKLVIMYAKCGNLLDAREILDNMPKRNVVSWTVMIAAYARYGQYEEALQLFSHMQRTEVQPNQFTYATVLAACANLEALERGKEIHGDVIRSRFEADVFVGSALLDMYCKCGRIENARHVFDKMSERNVVSWNAMIAGYAQNGLIGEALGLFEAMPEWNVASWTTMIAGYAQIGQVDAALKLFQKMPERNEISWNTIVAGYAQNGRFIDALKLFRRMQLTGVKPSSVTFVNVLSACVDVATLKTGKEVHESIIKTGFHSDIFVASALLDMYAKCGNVEDAYHVFARMSEQDMVSWTAIVTAYAQNGHVDEAQKLFQKMPERNAVSWNTMIAGYAQNEQFNEALSLFQKMQSRGVKPDSVTLISVLPACANLAGLKNGKEIHGNILRREFHSDVFVGSCLVDMYAKCGGVEDAYKVFDKMPERDVVSWTAMIVGYAMHGYGKEALQIFEQMQHSGAKPNQVTFIGVLSACCHAGLVHDGWQYFDSMERDYLITPAMEHYCCMVDLLGRAGRLNEARDFIDKMPIKPNAAVWGSLLGACRIHCNIELGEHVAGRLFDLEPNNASGYVLLSNIYAAAGRWDDVERVRQTMKTRRVQKIPGCSWIEVNNRMYSFVARDRSHPEMHNIYVELDRLSGQMKEAGYLSDTNLALHDVEEEHRENLLCHHSEKLAIAFGLIHVSPGTPIRIIKNLRVCGDCHSAIKFISKIVAREIIVRDTSRFHHFKGGQCSCGDYW